MRKRKEEREACAIHLVRDSQNEHGKDQGIEECNTKEEDSKDTFAFNVLLHIPVVCPEKCGFSASSARCRHTKNALIAVPPSFAQISSDTSTT
jgi:hypothetical protein